MSDGTEHVMRISMDMRVASLSPPCQIGAHDTCDPMTSDFLTEHPEVAPFNCHCSCHIGRYIAERDRARDIACRLEQENAEALRLAREALSVNMFEAKPFDALEGIVGVLGSDTDGA